MNFIIMPLMFRIHSSKLVHLATGNKRR